MAASRLIMAGHLLFSSVLAITHQLVEPSKPQVFFSLLDLIGDGLRNLQLRWAPPTPPSSSSFFVTATNDKIK
jgi:hypothetical protein